MKPIILLTSLLLACGSDSVTIDGGADGSTTNGSTTLDSSTTTTSTSTGTSGADETSQTSVAFVDDDLDAGSSWSECNLFVQDCPPGLKCMPYASDGSSSWNAWGCFPVIDDPADPGEPCTVEGNGASGIDTCAVGSMCWNVDLDTNEGTCVALCLGDHDDPHCEEPLTTCAIASDGALALCLPACRPLEPDCPEGQGCYPGFETFGCAPDVSREMGVAGDPCEFINVCDPGTFCASPRTVPDCEGSGGCCSSFCTLGDDSPCLPGQTCQPWYEPRDAPPGYADLGACALP